MKVVIVGGGGGVPDGSLRAADVMREAAAGGA